MASVVSLLKYIYYGSQVASSRGWSCGDGTEPTEWVKGGWGNRAPGARRVLPVLGLWDEQMDFSRVLKTVRFRDPPFPVQGRLSRRTETSQSPTLALLGRSLGATSAILHGFEVHICVLFWLVFHGPS